MADRYVVEAWGYPGVLLDRFESESWEEVMEAGMDMVDRCSRRPALSYGNIDRADIGDDGLTEEQRAEAPYY